MLNLLWLATKPVRKVAGKVAGTAGAYLAGSLAYAGGFAAVHGGRAAANIGTNLAVGVGGELWRHAMINKWPQKMGAGALESFGLAKNPEGKWRLLGGKYPLEMHKGKLRLGTKFMSAPPIMSMLGIGMTAFSAIEGFQQGGIGGAIKGVAMNAAQWAAWSLVGTPLVVGGLAYAGYAGLDALAAKGKRSKVSEFASGSESLYTEAAATMRQRALSEIQRSHMNARTALGQEASLLHQ